jgi:hypothetical protein
MRAGRKAKLIKGRKWPVALTSAAKRLDCTPSHLARVLKDERSSSRLKARYQALADELAAEGRAA